MSDQKKHEFLLAPSILAADLANLSRAVETCAEGEADLIHVDVMDGHFVPNLTFGVPMVSALARRTEIPLDVHLMVSNPERLLDEYLEAGADWLSIHWEAAQHADRLVARIREAGCRAGIALNPATPIEALYDILPSLDFVLVMSVNPGFAGQKFLPYCLEKAERLHKAIVNRGLAVKIQMDGGVDASNVARITGAGVAACVAGSAIFGSKDPIGAMREIREKAKAA